MFQNQPFLLTVFILLFGASSTKAQNCINTWATASAPSGLIIRESPGQGYIDKIPFGDTVRFCAEKTYGDLTFDKIEGHWRKVFYKGKSGYSFDGFLQPFEMALATDSLINASKELIGKSDSVLGIKKDTAIADPVIASSAPHAHPNFKNHRFQFLIETYNYCGNVQAINLNDYWYGVFMDNELNPTGELAVRPVKLKVSLSKTNAGGKMEFDILTSDEERSLFLFSIDNSYPHQELKLADVLQIIGTRGQRLFPGQEWLLDPISGLKLSATGTITKAGPCPEAKDYSIKAIRGKASNEEQDLKELLGDYGTCSIPEIYWYGDLSGDGIPEIIFVSVKDDMNVFTLLQSEVGENQLFSLKSVFTVENCTD